MVNAIIVISAFDEDERPSEFHLAAVADDADEVSNEPDEPDIREGI